MYNFQQSSRIQSGVLDDSPAYTSDRKTMQLVVEEVESENIGQTKQINA